MLTLLALLAAADPTHAAAATSAQLARAAPPALAEGRYALVMRFVTEADAPLVGKVTTTTVTTALVDVQARDGRTLASQRACSMVTDGGLFVARAGAGFIDAMPPARYEIVLDGDRVVADMGVASVAVEAGARALPKSASGFTDPDRDGNKGAPLDVDVGGMRLRLDVASVGHAVLEGTLRDGRVQGKPRVLFSDERILGGLPFASGTKQVVADKSSFTLERLEGAATCASVRG